MLEYCHSDAHVLFYAQISMSASLSSVDDSNRSAGVRNVLAVQHLAEKAKARDAYSISETTTTALAAAGPDHMINSSRKRKSQHSRACFPLLSTRAHRDRVIYVCMCAQEHDPQLKKIVWIPKNTT